MHPSQIAAALAAAAGLPDKFIRSELRVDDFAPDDLFGVAESLGIDADDDESTIRAAFSTTEISNGLIELAEVAVYAGFTALASQSLTAALTIPFTGDTFNDGQLASVNIAAELSSVSGSEIKHRSVSVSGGAYKVVLFAAGLTFSRQMIRDFGSLGDLLVAAASKLGVSAYRTIEHETAAALNAISVEIPATALDSAGLQAATTALRGRRAGGIVVDYRPTTLIVSSELESAARALVGPTRAYPDIGLAVSSRLTATEWSLAFRDPLISAPLAMVTLDGAAPRIAAGPAPFSTLGVEMICSHAFCVAALDSSAIVKCATS